jgi:MFS family permease
MGVVAFVPLYLQVGQGVSATTSGTTMLSASAGMILSSTVIGHLVSHTGRYKPFMLFGAGMLIFGFLLMSFIGPSTPVVGVGWRLFIVGIGLGPAQSLFGLAVQNAVHPRQIGVASSSSQFVRQMGSTIGVALFGAVLTHGISTELANRAPREPGVAQQSIDISRLQTIALSRVAAPGARPGAGLSAPMLVAVSESFGAAIRGMFRLAVAFMAAALAVMLYIPVLKMRSRHDAEPEAAVKEA